MITGIVVTHGKLGEELLQTAREIYGQFSDCYAVSSASRSTEALAEKLNNIVSSLTGKSCIIFIDFLGGSCSFACLKLLNDHQNISLITGVNLPIFLSFLNKREEVPFDELPEELVARGKRSIQIVRREDF
jgi:fructoselysine and glucoselysine-specific PTS system IIA component